jgi:hypothetical protein
MRHFSIIFFFAFMGIFKGVECRVKNGINDWDEDGEKIFKKK